MRSSDHRELRSSNLIMSVANYLTNRIIPIDSSLKTMELPSLPPALIVMVCFAMSRNAGRLLSLSAPATNLSFDQRHESAFVYGDGEVTRFAGDQGVN